MKLAKKVGMEKTVHLGVVIVLGKNLVITSMVAVLGAVKKVIQKKTALLVRSFFSTNVIAVLRLNKHI